LFSRPGILTPPAHGLTSFGRALVGVWEETRKTVLYVTHNVAEAV
jgi:ABC-type nitrate/sulfonate/bicarbonate transport system ATPase subunit